MKVLVACECSGAVRDAFREKGHDAYSCDILPSDQPSPYHFQMHVELLLHCNWDMVIAFPPCTHLSVSGARYWKEKQNDGRQQRAIDFFLMFANLRHVPKVAIENPIGIISTFWRKPDQIIQPWQFGHPESKATCLWLKNLPKLQSTNILRKPESGHWNNQTKSGQNKLAPSKDRAKIRSRTYQGIAKAMAEQWGG